MPAILENPQHRKRGIASLYNAQAPRYQQPDADEWRAFDDTNHEQEKQATAIKENNEKEKKLAARPQAKSYRSRRRKKRKMVGDDNEFAFATAEAFDAAKSFKQQNHQRKKSKRRRKDTESTATTTEDTPRMPEEEASTRRVSPDDEAPGSSSPATPVISNKTPRHGKRVLDVEYSPNWKAIQDSAEQQHDGESQMDSGHDEVIDRLTSKNAADSPRPYDTRGAHKTVASDAIESKTLEQVVQEDGRVVTKDHFFSVSSLLPVETLAIAETTKTRTFKGKLGDGPVHWAQAAGGAGRRLLLTTVRGDTSTNDRRQLEWEAAILDWVHSCCSDDESQLISFPKPLWLLQDSPENNGRVLCLSLTNDRDSCVEFDVFGTLEDLIHSHAIFNNGPLPEALCANLVVQVLKCVRILHQSGVTHDNLGLDSFLLGRRKKDNADGWFLVCTGLGSEAKVCKQSIKNDENVSASIDSDRTDWRFKHDLYSVANIFHLLLSGGVPLSFTMGANGLIELQSKQFVSSIYLRGRLAWQGLFKILLNPPSASCSLSLVDDSAEKWKHDVASILRMLESMSVKKEVINPVLSQLMGHIQQGGAADFQICSEDRFPVKLASRFLEATTDSSHDSSCNEQHSTREMELSRALRDNDAKISLLTQNLQHSKDQEQNFRQLASDSLSTMEVALAESRELAREKRELAQLATRQKTGFLASIREKERALTTLRSKVKESVAAEQHLRNVYYAKEGELRTAQERIQTLEAEQSFAAAKLDSAKGIICILRQEKLTAEASRAQSESGALEALQLTHSQSLAKMRDEHEKESASQKAQIRQLEEQVSSEVELRNQAESSVGELQRELSRFRESMESQSRVQDDSQQSQAGEIDRLTNLVHSLTESERQLRERNEELESSIHAQTTSFEAELSARNVNFQRTEQELRIRIRELEGTKMPHGQQTGESSQRTRRPRPKPLAADAVQQQDSSMGRTQKTPSSSRPPSKPSKAPRSSTKQSASTRLQQATASVIPGLSLTQASYRPDNVPSFRPDNVPSSQPPSTSRKRGKKPRVIFCRPRNPESDDSDED